ncbi:hypothetical protein FS837_004467 [Tulasnella sp. UAMH 9824]|nr:hypothetical protein FS837_004467 [Tulasnella sp. UAMH 9824]
MAAPLKAFGISLIVFYLTGSRATKVGKERKVSLEEGHMEAGYRDGWQLYGPSRFCTVVHSVRTRFDPLLVLHGIRKAVTGPRACHIEPVGDDLFFRQLVCRRSFRIARLES